MYSSVCETPTATNLSVGFQTPPLIGKGDGYSFESALKDSMHPDLVGVVYEDNSMSMMMQSQGYVAASENKSEQTRNANDKEEASFCASNMPKVAALPVK